MDEKFPGDLTGHVALITAGRRGMGAAIGRRLAAAGAAVVLAAQAVQDDGLVEALDAITAAGGRAASIAFDLADGAAIIGDASTCPELV